MASISTPCKLISQKFTTSQVPHDGSNILVIELVSLFKCLSTTEYSDDIIDLGVINIPWFFFSSFVKFFVISIVNSLNWDVDISNYIVFTCIVFMFESINFICNCYNYIHTVYLFYSACSICLTFRHFQKFIYI